MIEVTKVVEYGYIVYYKKGTKILHREDGPAVEWTDGTKEWYRNGKRHRDDGPAAIWTSGRQEWYFYGRLHRDDGPAIEWGDRSKEWFVNGKKHREDGPALVYTNGRIQWWLNGRIYTKKDWFEALNEEQKVKALYSEYFIEG